MRPIHRAPERRSLAVAASLVVLLTGCGPLTDPSRACTAIGALNGVSVRPPPPVRIRPGAVSVEVCQDGSCESQDERVRYSTDRVDVVFADFARRFDAGAATVTVRVTGQDGAVVADVRREVELVRSYPNGRECDGVGYLNATIELDGL